ncbi:UNVERIFIED_CONTAM: hypothetical protein GTU68_021160 [Idotea baltica]|nr:hypothetical protein [Idotea baltica]
MTKTLGILNITDDSFSDGGKYNNPETALQHALQLHNAGADYVELGPSSTHPDSKASDAETEIEKISGVLRELIERKIPVAIDSFHPQTQIYAAENGATLINDVTGFSDNKVHKDLAKLDCTLVPMFSVAEEASKQSFKTTEVLSAMYTFFEERLKQLQAAGVKKNRIVIDPGMGFFLGSDEQTSFKMLSEIPAIRKKLQHEIFISVSRKSFLRNATGLSIESSLPATLSAELKAIELGASYVRTHDVAALKAALLVRSRIETAA